MTETEELPLREKIVAGLLALGGLALVWLGQFVMPEFLRGSVNAALAGAFGVLMAMRLWPGLPLRRLPWWLGAIVVYGLAVGLVGLM